MDNTMNKLMEHNTQTAKEVGGAQRDNQLMDAAMATKNLEILEFVMKFVKTPYETDKK